MHPYQVAPQEFYDGQINIPEKGNGVPDILDEAYWAMRMWLGLQDKNGGVFNGPESNGDPNFTQTAELDPLGDYAYAKDAAGSFTFAGVMAQASRLRKSLGKEDEASDFLSRARRAYEWALKNPPKKLANANDYSKAYLSPKAYAAAELLHATGEKRFNDDFLASCVLPKRPDTDIEKYKVYDQKRAAWAYVNCDPKLVDARAQEAARDAIIRWADWMIEYSSTMAYSSIRHPHAPIPGAQVHIW